VANGMQWRMLKRSIGSCKSKDENENNGNKEEE